jgi:hypothetical protein
MAIIYQHDKRSGITYAYESLSFWDKEKKQSRAKRTLIGRLDPVSGEIISTDGRCKKDKVNETEVTEDKVDDPDYKVLYDKLLKKCMAQETLIASLKKENRELKGEK